MITVNNLSYGFPQKELFHDISFTLEEGQHCAFIGVSGSGKSTLVDLIMDSEKYMFDGDIDILPGCKIGYINQFSTSDKIEPITVFEYIAKDCLKLKQELNAICDEMATATELDDLFEKYQTTLDAFEAVGGEDFESLILKQLHIAGLTRHKDLMLAQLSGGEFKLVQIIKEMLHNPHLLIMDEPDAFLDFENINALKNLINAHKGTLLVITHSRYLLDHCFNKIIHLENKELQEFDGTYLDYNFSLLERKIELQELAQKDTEEIERNEALIEKLREAATNNADASRGKALKARVKIQERLMKRRIKAPFVEIKQPELDLATTSPLSEDTTALSVSNYSLAFDELLLENVSFEIKGTEKVALIGANGTGKTTLLRDIFRAQKAAIHFNEETEIAYLSQLQGEVLSENSTILEAFLDFGFKNQAEILSHLRPFGFKREMLSQKISSLSGGEKNILQLAQITTGNANMLLLDEPTSHLDIYTQLALEKSLKDYNGAILMVSHDFYTIANCMDYVLIIEDRTIRRMSIRKFRKMIYAKHFDKDYLEIEQRKKAVEMKIATALKNNNFKLAQSLCDDFGKLIGHVE